MAGYGLEVFEETAWLKEAINKQLCVITDKKMQKLKDRFCQNHQLFWTFIHACKKHSK